MAAAESATGTSLEYTPTWALATVCFFFISISIVLEHLIYLLTNWLKKNQKRGLGDAVDKLKSELMLLGFISLLLAATQKQISEICISEDLADTMLPCRKETETIKTVEDYQRFRADSTQNYNMGDLHNLSSFDSNYFSGGDQQLHRHMAEDEEDDDDDTTTTSSNNTTSTDLCTSKGKVSLVSQQGLQQLQVFIFGLALMQIVYSVLTMALGRAKMKRWEAWEKETQTTDYQIANDPNRFRFTRDTSFGRRHMTNYTITDTSLLLWIRCFFRQFLHSVAKVDYFTLRHGFIAAHLSSRHSNFNFQKYIQRSLEEDFKVVVGISPLMWFIVVIFMLVDVRGWNVYLWVSYVPLLLVLVLGTKMEVIVARMALEIKNQNSVVVGTPLVQPNDKLFWFGQPKFVLTILHYTLFVNAFELAFFIWVTIQFGVNSCYHEHTIIIVTRLVLAVMVQVLCSYKTLPLYALVTQMGSQFKGNVLEDQTAGVIKQWHADVREKRKKAVQDPIQSPRTSVSTRPRLSNASESSIRRGKMIWGEEDNDDDEGGSSSRGGISSMLEMVTPPVRR